MSNRIPFHHNVYSPTIIHPTIENAPQHIPNNNNPEFPQPDSDSPPAPSSSYVSRVPERCDPIDVDHSLKSILNCCCHSPAKIALMANLSRNGSDALTEVHNPDNLTYDLINQSEQIMTSSEQSNDVNQTETEITSDSNIIPYSQYLSETQQETVQNSNSSAQQDALILSMFEQLNTQVMNCTNVNLEYKSANKALTTELDRYKEEVKRLKENEKVEYNFFMIK
ncbi:hypothetical protein Tco_0365185 [Tanacetum coccineum]